jgi:uncharacterized SAM-binding protein YcdF (DUF218 family)
VRRILRHPILGAIALLLLLATILVGLSALSVWRAAHQDDASRVEKVDAIVVLGAAQWNGQPSPVFRGRLEQAVVLWGEHRAGVVLVLGSNQPGDATTEGEAGRAYLISRGVPPGDVVSIPIGHTSYESLVAAADYMNKSRLRSVFLVSDPWHNARIKKMATDLGLRAYASATWTSAYQSRRARLTGYVRETFAYLYYRLFSGH